MIDHRLAQMKKHRLAQMSLFLLVFLSTLYFLLATSYADIPHLINYQGKLADDEGNPIDGAKSIAFRIYDAPSNGSLLWSETQAVTVRKGIFNVLLGAAANLDLVFDKPYYLEIAIQVSESVTETLTPRQRLLSSGNAIRVKSAPLLIHQNVYTDLDVGAVDGFSASATPKANHLLVLDENGNVPNEVFTK